MSGYYLDDFDLAIKDDYATRGKTLADVKNQTLTISVCLSEVASDLAHALFAIENGHNISDPEKQSIMNAASLVSKLNQNLVSLLEDGFNEPNEKEVS